MEQLEVENAETIGVQGQAQRSGMTRNVKRSKAAKAQQKVSEQSECFDDEISKLLQ